MLRIDGGARLATGHHEREKQKKEHAPNVDLEENLSLGGTVVSSKLAILHTETIMLEDKMSNRSLLNQ
jgi:hypothetical protein